MHIETFNQIYGAFSLLYMAFLLYSASRFIVAVKYGQSINVLSKATIDAVLDSLLVFFRPVRKGWNTLVNHTMFVALVAVWSFTTESHSVFMATLLCYVANVITGAYLIRELKIKLK